ncbi:hypothetical protein [Brassicibacter mesophilus]|uniref:hypothetical protein n=1 Tax=Brassicibacter mesophilus TaxID=745119 RepID=UPI003D1CC434
MSIIEFRPYKRLEDKELIIRTYRIMEMMRLASDEEDEEAYNREVLVFNEMIKEIRLRNLRNEIDIFVNTLFHF